MRVLKEVYQGLKNGVFEYAKERGRQVIEFIRKNPEEPKERLKNIRENPFQDLDRDLFFKVNIPEFFLLYEVRKSEMYKIL